MSFMDPNMQLDAKQLLREDDSLLRQIFFNVLKHHHPQLAAKVWRGARDRARRARRGHLQGVAFGRGAARVGVAGGRRMECACAPEFACTRARVCALRVCAARVDVLRHIYARAISMRTW